MTPASNIPIVAFVTPNEQVIMDATATHIAQALSQAAGQTITCACEVAPDIGALVEANSGTIVVTSMLAQLDRLDEPWKDVEADLRDIYSTLCERGDPVMILTILRHVQAGEDHDQVERMRIRIRRLNLLAAELSREFGAFVIDLDRVLADIGALRLETDYRLGGAAAADVAAKTVALSIVTNALDDLAPFNVQDAAREVLIAYQPAVALPAEIKPQNLMSLGKGRRKQVVSTVTDTVQENHVGWLIEQVMKGQIGPAEAFDKLVQAVRRRGARESVALLASGVARKLGLRT